VRRAKESDIEKLAKATGGRIINNLDDLKAKDLGEAGLVEERKIGDDKMVFIEKCKDPRSVSVLIRAGLEKMMDEAERAIHDALSVVADVIERNKIVAGGGAVEAEIAKELRGYSASVGGREQLAIEAFANALETVPKTLAENAGLNTIDILVALRSAHQKKKGVTMGVNVFSGGVTNMLEDGVIEPVWVKQQALKSAAEVASMILRIDDVIAATKPKTEGMPSRGEE
jgi:chaperonin GroEL (HSP60 family)